MTAVRVLPEAERDVDSAANYYAHEASLDVALRFLSAIEDTYGWLVERPLAGPLVNAFHPRLNGLRHRPVPGFESHLIFYLTTPGRIEVVRVLHGAQDLESILGEQG